MDNIISFISPRAECERQLWRQYLDEMRSYDAGDYGRLNARWRVFNESAESTDKHSRDTIRARARDLERNSDMANGIISAFKRNVVGNGFSLQAQTGNPEINIQIEALWKSWCKKQNCDVTGQQSFNQIIRMAVQRKKVDGGILFLKCYSGTGPVPFQLQALEVDELSMSQMTPKHKGNKVAGGVEYNRYNRPVGYWIQKYSIDGMEMPEAKYYDAKDIIFYYTKRRPSQVREISDLAPSITRIRDANEFITAVSVKERIAACLAVFVKRTVPTGAAFGGRSTIQGDGEMRKSYDGKSLAPGMIREMNAGDEIQVVDPKGSGDDATGFLKLLQRLVGSGQGLSYESTSRDMSQTNYSSARQGGIEDDLTYAEERELLQECFMTEVYETFLISAYLSGALDMPGFFDRKAEYMSHEWVASPKKWIDPQKEANANKIALETGQRTFKQMAAEQGYQWQNMIDDMAEVNEYAKKKGVQIGGVTFGTNTGTDTGTGVKRTEDGSN